MYAELPPQSIWTAQQATVVLILQMLRSGGGAKGSWVNTKDFEFRSQRTGVFVHNPCHCGSDAAWPKTSRNPGMIYRGFCLFRFQIFADKVLRTADLYQS